MATQTLATDDLVVLNDMLPVDPFRSLYVHFGMLLGVDDIRTIDAYHRGKMWYHSAWQHGQGVLWGLEVDLGRIAPTPGEDTELTGEVKVSPGAALDALGRELYLQQAACVNLDAWFDAHGDDPELKERVRFDDATGDVIFDAHVSLEFRGCLDRQVPALSEPCDGAASTTAYSRVVETVDLCLHPGKAPDWRANGLLPFHRVRLLFGIDQPLDASPDNPGVASAADQEVLDARNAILAAPAEDRVSECLKWLRHFTVLDEMAMQPQQPAAGGPLNLFPLIEPAPVYLANLCDLRLRRIGEAWQVLEATVDNFVRPVHLPTSTIQELLCCCPATPLDEQGEDETEAPGGDDEDDGGPRIDADTVALANGVVSFTVVGGVLMLASIDIRAVYVGTFDTGNGWNTIDVESIDYDAGTGRVDINLGQEPAGNPTRLIVRGTGETPFIGRNRVPLAGAVGGPPGSKNEGNDFVHMFRGS